MAIDVKYFLEIWNKGELVRSISLPLTSDVRLTFNPAKNLSWSLGREPVREFAGVREESISVAGRSGKRARRDFEYDAESWVGKILGSYGASSQTNPMGFFDTGPNLFRRFEDFIREYEALAASYASKINLFSYMSSAEVDDADARMPRMVFRAIDEKVSKNVEITNFSWVRSAFSSRFSYEWTMNMVAYGEARPMPGNELLDSMTDFASNGEVFSESVASVISFGGAVMQDIRGAVLSSFRPYAAGITNAANAMGYVSKNYKGMVETAPQLGFDFLRSFRKLYTATLELGATLDYPDRYKLRDRMAAVDYTFSVAESNVLNALSIFKYRMSSQEIEESAASDRPLQSAVPAAVLAKTPCFAYAVLAGQTIFDIAEMFLGDASLWPQILEVNDLLSPYFQSTGEPLVPGTLINVPAPAPSAQPVGQADFFGTDLALSPDGELIASGSEDLAAVSGEANLGLALTIRMLTEKGQNSVFPRYGLPTLVGEKVFEGVAGYLAAHVNDQLMADPRITKVTRLSILDEGDTLAADVTVQTVTGGTFNVVLPYPV